jgi:hypothetical protein
MYFIKISISTVVINYDLELFLNEIIFFLVAEIILRNYSRGSFIGDKLIYFFWGKALF